MTNVLDKKTLNTAYERAYLTTIKHLQENGENPVGCGFAWVDVKARSNSKVGKLLLENGFEKAIARPGLTVWNPSCSFTQDMEAKFAGAQVFAQMLNQFGVEATARCRLD